MKDFFLAEIRIVITLTIYSKKVVKINFFKNLKN